MASTKRKRNSTSAKANKKAKTISSSASETEQLWEALCILNERRARRRGARKGAREYLIKWIGINPDTGRAWESSWEPEGNANEALVASWEEEKARIKSNTLAPAQQQDTQSLRRNCHSRVIESSPETSARSSPSSAPSSVPSNSAGPADQSSTIVSSPVDTPLPSNRVSPRIHLQPRGNSLEREDFEWYSQLATSKPNSAQPHTQDTDLDSSQLFAAAPYSTGIVPDSQSSAGERSFIPVTHRTEDTTQQDASPEDEGITEDSGLLDIEQDAATHAASPARSIPETIPDTTIADSQSQNPSGAERRLDLIGSSSQAVQDQHEGARIEQAEEGQGVAQAASLEEHSEPVIQQSEVCIVDSQRVQDSASQDIAPKEPHQQVQHEDVSIGQPLEVAEVPVVPVDRIGSNQADPSNQNTADINPPNTVTETGALQVQASQQPADCSLATLAESSVPDEAAQLPFQSQQHLHQFTQAPIAGAQQLASAETGDSGVLAIPSATIPEQAASPPVHQVSHQSAPTLPEQPTLIQGQDFALLQQFNRSVSTVRQEPALQESPSTILAQSAQAQVVQGCHSPPRSTGHSAEGQHQNAQIVPVEADLSFQEYTTQSLWPTIEHTVRRESSESRHDSSQETPEKSRQSREDSSSPIPYPPIDSLEAQFSKVLPRPGTPAATSSLSVMDSPEDIERKLKEAIAKAKAERPYTPKRRPNRSSLTPAKDPSASVAAPTLATSLLRNNESLEGTRSPSAVPDRLPTAHAPTSLRTVASASSSLPRAPSPRAEVAAVVPLSSGAQAEPTEVEVTVAADPTAPTRESAESDAMEISPPDNSDTESLLNDGLQLAEQEFIVPLSMHGKQRDWYSQYITGNKELVLQFLANPGSINPVSRLEEAVEYLSALETHVDLVFAEAQSGSPDEELSISQAETAAGWGVENSTKFTFLHTLFRDLRDSESQKHIVIVVAKANDAILHILETFCRGNHINYSIPTNGRQAKGVEGNLLVTILPSHASPIIRAPDMIVCLDGVQDAIQIRKKNWARAASVGGLVPVIHLVVPRTVGHIERYISPGLDPRDRLHTVLAGLVQVHVRSEIGQAIDNDTPQATKCASMVATWLMQCMDEEDEIDWPLPSIGSVKDVIEYQTQHSPTSNNSPVDSPAPERIKRPFENEDLDPDPSKRMRFTPQPQTVTNSSANHEHDTTYISDSMPGTAAVDANKRSLQEAYQKERQAREEQERRFLDQKEMWEKQQTVHEDLTREYRLFLGKQQATETKLETLTKNNAILTDRLTTRTTELREVEQQLQEERTTHLLSPDDKIAEITRLRVELAEAKAAQERALKSVSTTENMLEYTKEAYRGSQDAASKATSRVSELEASTEKLSLTASGQAAKLKAIHHDRNYALQEQQLKNLRAELLVVKSALKIKDEEVVRLRSVGRPGVGTRGASATPQPKIRSRAASPSFGGRLSNLRNG